MGEGKEYMVGERGGEERKERSEYNETGKKQVEGRVGRGIGRG